MITHEQLDALQDQGMVGEQMTNHLLIDVHRAITHLTSRIDRLLSYAEKIERKLEREK